MWRNSSRFQNLVLDMCKSTWETTIQRVLYLWLYRVAIWFELSCSTRISLLYFANFLSSFVFIIKFVYLCNLQFYPSSFAFLILPSSPVLLLGLFKCDPTQIGIEVIRSEICLNWHHWLVTKKAKLNPICNRYNWQIRVNWDYSNLVDRFELYSTQILHEIDF